VQNRTALIDTHPDKGLHDRGYWHVQCIPWKCVKRIAYDMELSCYKRAKKDELEFGRKYWTGRTPSWLLDEILMGQML